jgi:F-type H+-transporting ATPase subunit a
VKTKLNFSVFRGGLFPSVIGFKIKFYSFFLFLRLLDLISLVTFSYPVTTTLAFNLRAALFIWLYRILFLRLKINWTGSLLPLNSPWYLISFLGLVELVRILVRPLTLCFRLLANISAGHILLSLACKLSSFFWVRGRILGLLELMVSVVQSFVFLILIRVYLEEGASH